MGELRLHVLGVTRVEKDGVAVKLIRRKSLALLVYLAVTKRVHTRAALADVLAGFSARADTREHLRNSLSELAGHPQLRGYVVVTRQTAAFNTELPHWTDVGAFELMLDEAIKAGSVDALRAAIGLHKDQFMAGFVVRDSPAFEEWMLLERERLRDDLIHALQLLTDLCIAQGRATDGAAAARQLLDLDPWCEEAHRQLMTVLAYTGQRSAALAQYETCRRILATDLGVAPLAATRALHDQLRHGVTAPRHNLPVPSSPLIGRDDELTSLMGRLRDPACRLISIVGPSGSGKSRLALEAAHRCAAPTYAAAWHPFPGGVFIADHASAPGPTARYTPRAIIQSLGLPEAESGASLSRLLREVEGQKWLLVLDNAGQSRSYRDALGTMLGQAPGMTVLLAVPEPLRLPGEWTLQLGGLALPTSPAEVDRAPASRLFLQHAQRARPSFTLAAVDRDHVLRLCQLLDGLPGLLLHAASWVRGMRCAEIVEELEHTGSLGRPAVAGGGPAESPAGFGMALPSLLDTNRHAARQRLSTYHGSAIWYESAGWPFTESGPRPSISASFDHGRTADSAVGTPAYLSAWRTAGVQPA
jgi:DNA-binding SARP family transcriptional activator